jgi:hypothetical protein
MLVAKHAFWRVVFEIALMLVYWSLALLAYGARETVITHGQGILTFSDVRVALLFSVGFMVLSGYVVSVVILYVFYSRRKSWTIRTGLHAGLFIVHFGIFGILVGSSQPSITDLPLAIIGLIGVIAAGATVGLVLERSR